MTKQVLFFATGKDVLPILEDAERTTPLQYVRMGNFEHPGYTALARGADIPELGIASAPSSIACEAYLVSRASASVAVRSVRGGAGFCIDQLINGDTVTFTPAGTWGDDVVLHGRFATASDSKASQDLMKLFAAATRKNFTKIKSFWVGSQAGELLDAGKRLTIGTQCPRDYDLRR